MEIRKVRLVGNSLHVAIPEKMLKFIGVGKNNYVRVELGEEQITISALDTRKRERIGGRR